MMPTTLRKGGGGVACQQPDRAHKQRKREADAHPMNLAGRSEEGRVSRARERAGAACGPQDKGGVRWASTHRSEKTSIMSSRVRTVLVLVLNSLRMRPTRMMRAAGGERRPARHRGRKERPVSPRAFEASSAGYASTRRERARRRRTSDDGKEEDHDVDDGADLAEVCGEQHETERAERVWASKRVRAGGEGGSGNGRAPAGATHSSSWGG